MTDPTYTLRLTCKNGHTQDLRCPGQARAWVEHLGKLMDGTSPFYVYPPDDRSVIGKCCICFAPFTSEIVEEPNG